MLRIRDRAVVYLIKFGVLLGLIACNSGNGKISGGETPHPPIVAYKTPESARFVFSPAITPDVRSPLEGSYSTGCLSGVGAGTSKKFSLIVLTIGGVMAELASFGTNNCVGIAEIQSGSGWATPTNVNRYQLELDWIEENRGSVAQLSLNSHYLDSGILTFDFQGVSYVFERAGK